MYSKLYNETAKYGNAKMLKAALSGICHNISRLSMGFDFVQLNRMTETAFKTQELN